jgi:hypothetical protein
VAPVGRMPDVRFQSLDDEDLADIWYALSACANRHPHQFKALTDAVLNALLARQGDGLEWLERRFRAIRAADAKEDAAANARVS